MYPAVASFKRFKYQIIIWQQMTNFSYSVKFRVNNEVVQEQIEALKCALVLQRRYILHQFYLKVK